VSWKRSELERETLRALTEAVAWEFGRLGLGELEVVPWLREPGHDWTEDSQDAYHHSGATRMSTDPRNGVVAPDCAVYGVRGLYVVSGSVFPASGYANPTLTIVAVGIRVADLLREGALAA
jgi:choline dehydrogenase-like flavoprotein